MAIIQKVLDVEALDRLLYTERPPCPHVLAVAVQECLERAFSGLPDNQLSIALCLQFAMNGNDTESIRKFYLIACTGQLPYVQP